MIDSVFTRELHASSTGPTSTTFKLVLPAGGRALRAQVSLGRLTFGHAHTPQNGASFRADVFIREVCIDGFCFDFPDTKPQATGSLGVSNVRDFRAGLLCPRPRRRQRFRPGDLVFPVLISVPAPCSWR
jgi:hypothetical protein